MAANCKCYKTTNIGELKLVCPVHGNEAVERRAKQAALWKQAENNMPYRVKYHTTDVVRVCENQHPTVPEYILGAARKKLVHVNGKLCRIETVEQGTSMASNPCLPDCWATGTPTARPASGSHTPTASMMRQLMVQCHMILKSKSFLKGWLDLTAMRLPGK